MYFRGSHDTETGGEELMLMTFHTLPNPRLNISHHIMQQAFKHEPACGRLGGSDKRQAGGGEEVGERRGHKDRMTDSTKHTTATTIYNHADLKHIFKIRSD